MNKGDMISYLINKEHELRISFNDYRETFGNSVELTNIMLAKWCVINEVCCDFGLEDRLIR